MSNIKERYQPIVIGVNTSIVSTSSGIGGFLALTDGTLTVATRDRTPVTLINAVPVTAGVYTPLPFYVGLEGCTVTTAGGASGTLGV